MRDGIDVLQGVVVFDVVVTGALLHVDIYGSEANVCGSIRFTFPERDERRAVVRRLKGWRDRRTPLTFVANGSTITLQDDLAVFGDQCASAQP